MGRLVIEVSSMLVVIGIVWGDLRRQVADIKSWVRGHSNLHNVLDSRIIELQISQSAMNQYMKDNQASLNRIEQKLDRYVESH